MTAAGTKIYHNSCRKNGQQEHLEDETTMTVTRYSYVICLLLEKKGMRYSCKDKSLWFEDHSSSATTIVVHSSSSTHLSRSEEEHKELKILPAFLQFLSPSLSPCSDKLFYFLSSLPINSITGSFKKPIPSSIIVFRRHHHLHCRSSSKLIAL